MHILRSFLTALALIVFCTFWLSNRETFFPFLFGGLAFASSFGVLIFFAKNLTRTGKHPPLTGWRPLLRVLLGGFMKFVLPALLILYALQHWGEALWIGLGVLTGLVCAVFSLWMENRKKSTS